MNLVNYKNQASSFHTNEKEIIMREFILNTNYIELVKLLKAEGIAQTGGQAKLLVEQGSVQLNGKNEFRKRAKLKHGDVVTVAEIRITISSANPV
jgi:ribosome-associated protein